ncbi:MAG: enoyl-CoA hydratase/isomerase family protein [Deltaproteobacteria bacterium]|nr:enoyl-CoA hydratase/isomerase family protein [Deltaproteobacteria bacterium]
MSESVEADGEGDLLFEKQSGVATFTLNRPAARNALTPGMFLDLERRLIEIEADDEVRVVVLTGAGGAFSGGADLKPVSKEESRRTRASAFPGDRGGDILDRANRCILRLQRLPKPVLASIDGVAVGVGCSLALAADLRVASDRARLGVVFSKIGLGPDGGASYFLRNLVGNAKALELMFLGELVDAAEALRLGLVNRVVAPDDLAGATAELARHLASGPTLAYGFAKSAVYEGADLPLESVLDLEARNQQVAGRSRDAKEGIRAFLEKRKPDFRGH